MSGFWYNVLVPRERGMAQRGEIQCAERQFALQSGRPVKREKFRLATHCRGKRNALASLRVSVRAFLTASQGT